MDKIEIIALSAAVFIIAVRLIQKYYKKDLNKSSGDQKKSAPGSFSSDTESDDYEPYSKK